MQPFFHGSDFIKKHPWLGPIIWISTAQFFIVQVYVASFWQQAYSWRNNTISDLGSTACGMFEGRYVCSPMHNLMSWSLIILGLAIAIGSVLIYKGFRADKALTGFALMSLVGIGAFLAGLFPENELGWLHDTGAMLAFGLGSVSLMTLAYELHRVRWELRLYTLITGIFAAIAFILYAFDIYLGLGQGSMERLTSYPQILWFMLFGFYLTRRRFLRPRSKIKIS